MNKVWKLKTLCRCIFYFAFVTYITHFVVQNRQTFSSKLDMKDDPKEKTLFCERVWNNVLQSRRKQFTSRINPTHTVINEFLEIISVNKTICQGIGNLKEKETKLLIILVHSARSHFSERHTIRKSWGLTRKYYLRNVWQVITVFLVGQSDSCINLPIQNSEKWNNTLKEEQLLENEQKSFGDLVIGSFTDTYRNNTYKQLMGYKFVLERCSQADFIVKTDDDVFVNVPMILEKRSRDRAAYTKNSYDMYCKLLKDVDPPRCKHCDREKWFTTREEWPTDKLPSFCLGAFFAITRSWLEKLYQVRNLGGFYWVDDVFISGKLREIAEKEYGVKAKLMDNTRSVIFSIPKGLCKDVTKINVNKKRKKLPMFAHLERSENYSGHMKCFSDILLGTNLPFSL